jgi:regulator of sigma D
MIINKKRDSKEINQITTEINDTKNRLAEAKERVYDPQKLVDKFVGQTIQTVYGPSTVIGWDNEDGYVMLKERGEEDYALTVVDFLVQFHEYNGHIHLFENTYWHSHGKYQETYNELSSFIPPQNLSDNHYINLITTFGNLYYDLYNNGLCNKDTRLTPAKEYLDEFKEFIIKNLPKKTFFTKVYKGQKNEEAFERVLNAIIEIHINKQTDTI